MLSCFRCNNERDTREHEMMPREKVRAMCNNCPVSEKPLEELQRIERLLVEKLEQPKRPLLPRDRKSIERSLTFVREAIGSKYV